MTEHLIRFIYGVSLSAHNVIASICLGTSIILFLLAVFIPNKNPNKHKILKINLNVYFLSIVLSAFSGFLFEIEFKRFWPILNDSLIDFNDNSAHSFAVISYLLTPPILFITYYFKYWKNYKLFNIISFLLIFHALLFSFWGIYINTIMQFPFNAEINSEGVLVLKGTVLNRFFSGYHLNRQIHIAAASTLKAGFLMMMIFYYTKNLKVDLQKTILKICIAAIVIISISGHFQIKNIAKYQPAKFAVMENITTKSEKKTWKPFGIYSFYGKEYAFKIEGGLFSFIDEDLIIPIDDIIPKHIPNRFLVYNSFRTMMLLGLIMFIITVLLLFKSQIISIKYFIWLFIFSELAINAGWLLSEVGRQPWFFYDLLERTSVDEIQNLSSSFGLLVINIIFLVFASFYSFKILIKTK